MAAPRPSAGRRRLVDLGLLALLAAGYYASATLCLKLATVNESVTAVWAPTGIAVAALLLGGLRFWPGVAIGAYLANLATTGGGAATVAIALGNTLEGVAGAWLVGRFAAGTAAFDRALDAIKFCLLAGVVSPTISATVGVTALWLDGRIEPGSGGINWITWWLGDLAGAILVAPAILHGFGGPIARITYAKAVEKAVVLILIVAAGLVVFGGLSPLPAAGYPIHFLVAPLLVWSAFRFSRLASSVAVLVTAAIAIWGTVLGIGPFAGRGTNESLLLLQSFMSVSALSTLILAAAVHERNAARSALQATAEDLGRSNADLERFAHAASHDLKEPLRSVVGFTQLLSARYRGKLDGDADEFIGHAVKSAERLERLIDDLLAYSRAGSERRDPAPLPVEQPLQRALALLRGSIDAAGAAVTHDALPVVVGDAGQMAQLFQNLLSNALKFRGAEPPRVHVSARRDGTHWIFSVRDHGIGIEPQYATRIFTMFQRIHPRGEYDGSGVGLALCKRIVEQHGGRIWVESEPGRGADFRFTWPA